MQNKEEMIALALKEGGIMPGIALCCEGREEEKGQTISDLPFEH
ncbi:hypothetical protein [Bacillus paramycoides]|nr:hypothetical protein [Bacillus paramycoides]